MDQRITKLLYMAVGLASTSEKVRAMLRKMDVEGQLTEEEGKRIVDELLNSGNQILLALPFGPELSTLLIQVGNLLRKNLEFCLISLPLNGLPLNLELLNSPFEFINGFWY